MGGSSQEDESCPSAGRGDDPRFQPHPHRSQEVAEAWQEALLKSGAILHSLVAKLRPHLLARRAGDGHWLLPGQQPGHLPERHFRLNVPLPQRPGHGDAVMAIPHEVDVPNLDQFYRQQ